MHTKAHSGIDTVSCQTFNWKVPLSYNGVEKFENLPDNR